MTKKTKQRIADHGASVLGLAVAIANSWITIDWEHFEFTPGNIMKLSLSAIIALGGFASRIKTKNTNVNDVE